MSSDAPHVEGDTADSAYVRDYYLRDYLPCRVDLAGEGSAAAAVVGTCADAVWAGGGWNASLSTSETSALVAGPTTSIHATRFSRSTSGFD